MCLFVKQESNEKTNTTHMLSTQANLNKHTGNNETMAFLSTETNSNQCILLRTDFLNNNLSDMYSY